MGVPFHQIYLVYKSKHPQPKLLSGNRLAELTGKEISMHVLERRVGTISDIALSISQQTFRNARASAGPTTSLK